MRRIVSATPDTLTRRREQCLRGLRTWALLAVAAGLGGCAWLSAKQSELALRPTPGRPAAFASDTVGLRPGDLRFTVPVARAGAPPQQLALWWLPHADPQAPIHVLLIPKKVIRTHANLADEDAADADEYEVDLGWIFCNGPGESITEQIMRGRIAND